MILVTGGTGTIGRKLRGCLAGKETRFRLLALPGDTGAAELAGDACEVRYGDISDRAALMGICRGVDTVFHLAAVILSPGDPGRFDRVNVQGTANLVAEAEDSGVRHFIQVSSASVCYRRQNPYSASKAKAEEIVRGSRIPHWTILRPTLAYEEGGSREFTHFANYLKRFPVIPFIGTGKARKAPVRVDDLVQAMAGAVGNAAAYGQTYGLSGSEVISIRRMAEALLAHMGKKKVIVPVPVVICRLLALAARGLSLVTGKEPLLTWQTISGIIQNADLDNRQARQDLGFDPRGFTQGLGELASLKNCLAEEEACLKD